MNLLFCVIASNKHVITVAAYLFLMSTLDFTKFTAIDIPKLKKSQMNSPKKWKQNNNKAER